MLTMLGDDEELWGGGWGNTCATHTHTQGEGKRAWIHTHEEDIKAHGSTHLGRR